MPYAARPTVTLHDVAAAAALRYTVDASARALRRASDSIALVADDLTTPSMAVVVAAMEREARPAGARRASRPARTSSPQEDPRGHHPQAHRNG
ncbi:hypothetical protein ACFPOI_14300 [Nonomuraea angiospora]|uniref:DNA-binding LacI/PurR family transcriptional regulator n=1 Tax=Nonomuraea angiospora TaxID=46172 RepID=A0ABR9MFN5_9ACTN|nr:DNA-binding LacI/PurR family transcriptional regulator [Nonomuraea angiospora]